VTSQTSASDAKTSEKNTFFASKRTNFASISLRSENDSIFSLLFRFISLRSENDGSFSLPFFLFHFEAKMKAIVCFFFVLFSLGSIFVSLQISMFRIDAK
jgi:hypothetical protein